MECCGYNDRYDYYNLSKHWKNSLYCYGMHFKMKVKLNNINYTYI